MEPNSQTKLAGIDGVRAIACLMILFHHAFQHGSARPQWPFFSTILPLFLSSAQAGVCMFFVLSGLLLSLPFWNNYLNKTPMPSLENYAWRRIARIVPGFYLVLASSFIVQSIFVTDVQFELRRILAGFSFLSGFHYTTLFPVQTNGPLWSISFEMFSYLLLPLFMLGLFQWGKRNDFSTGVFYWCCVLLFIFLINHYLRIFFLTDNIEKGWDYGLIGGAKYWMPDYNPIGFFAHFSMGIFAAGIIAFINHNDNVRTFFMRVSLFDIVATAGLLFCILILWTQRNYGAPGYPSPLTFQAQPYNYPFFAASVALVVASAPFTRWIRVMLDNRFFVYTAKISYGLYLWHFLVMYLISKYVPEYFQGRFLEENNSVEDFYRWALLTTAAIILSFSVASASWFFLEKPILNFKRRPKSLSSVQAETAGS
jgi:peptidoglycan/LPS O-acetylase OafA/YrhL